MLNLSARTGVLFAALSGWMLALALATPSRTHAQAVGTTRPLAAMVGKYAKNPTGLYGTDLGWTFKHGNRLWMMFGDSWKTQTDYYLGNVVFDFAVAGDDALGHIDLTSKSFNSGPAVEAFIQAAPRPQNAFPWQISSQLVQAVSATGAKPITLFRDGKVETIKVLGPGLTPVTGFSNGRTDANAGAFGVFFRNEPLRCSQGCGEFSCDPGLGRCVEEGQPGPTPVSSPCVIGQTPRHRRCNECRAVPGSGGFCVDTRSSMYDSSPRGRASAVVVTQEVGCATESNNLSRTEPSRSFDTRPWNTHRFFNAMARTVNDFDPARVNGAGNDYKTADGVNPAREGVFVWGRPHFGGRTSAGRDVQLYLAWVPMPTYKTNGTFAWTPSYFAGLDASGRPRFVSREVDSVSLPLNGTRDGGRGEDIDVVGQMTISWIPQWNRWVMIYGGGLSDQFGGLIFGEDWAEVQNEGTNAGPLYFRTAQQPWGPWTAPRPMLQPGDPNTATGLYRADEGFLYSPSCSGKCVQTEMAWNNPGGLYAPNIIEPWTAQRSGEVDLYWNLSTWNPYEVLLMKTTLSASDVQ